MEQQNKKPRGSLLKAKALTMALILPGLGQVFNGETIKGVLFFVTFALTIPLFTYAAVFLDGNHLIEIVMTGVLLAAVLYIAALVDAVRNAHRQRPAHSRNMALLLVLLPLIGAGGVLYPLSKHIRENVIESFYAPSASMEPGIAKGDYFFVNKRVGTPGFKLEILRGDIVVFVAPNHRNRYYVKRVIGLPGDKISCSEHVLKINGESVTVDVSTNSPEGRITSRERTASGEKYTVQWLAETPIDIQTTVPDGHIFVLGDNRAESLDSRIFGPVPLRDVEGIAWQVWFNRSKENLHRIGTILSPNH